jgi:uncharacterized protein (TIGR00369 family)
MTALPRASIRHFLLTFILLSLSTIMSSSSFSDLAQQQHSQAESARLLSVDGAPELVLQWPGVWAQPYAQQCLWDRKLHAQAAAWFATVRSAARTLGMAFVLLTPSRIVCRLVLDGRHAQPSGLLHGGISALIAEEMGSIGAVLAAAPSPAVGVSVAASHLASARVGDTILCVATPVKDKGKLQVWAINIYLDDDKREDPLQLQLPPAGATAVGSSALYWHRWRPSPSTVHLASCTLTALAQKRQSGPTPMFTMPAAAATTTIETSQQITSML